MEVSSQCVGRGVKKMRGWGLNCAQNVGVGDGHGTYRVFTMKGRSSGGGKGG